MFIEDGFDPTSWPVERDDDVCFISLSNRIDCTVMLDRIDYEWAKQYLWCHTYGSGSYDPETSVIDRPESIYARRSVPIGGFTASGRPRYGNEFLHIGVLKRVCPRPFWGHCGDHIDGDPLNCRRVNLRWATRIMNNRNRRGSQERARLLQGLAQIDKSSFACHNRVEILKVGHGQV